MLRDLPPTVELLQGHNAKGSDVGLRSQKYQGELHKRLNRALLLLDSKRFFYSDRPTWRNLIHSGAHAAEYNRTDAAEKKRETRKARFASNRQTTPILMCPTCGRGFHAKIGLISHLRTHQTDSRNSGGCHCHLRLRRPSNKQT